MIDRRVVAGLLAFMSVLAACSSDAVAPRGSVGPESLTVAFEIFPDTGPVGGFVFVGAIARNATNRVVFARWETGACGLTVTAYAPSGALFATAPPVCRGSGTWTLAPGDSTSTVMAIGLSGWPRGTYRVRAQVEAVDSRSPFVERSIVMP